MTLNASKRPAAFTIEIEPFHGTSMVYAWIKHGEGYVGCAPGHGAEDAVARALEAADERKWRQIPPPRMKGAAA